MADLPILFSAPMVRALLDGRKTQTRRIIKLPTKGEYVRADMGGWAASTVGGKGCYLRDGSPAPELPCVWNQTTGTIITPKWHVGDRLWVKETWGQHHPAGIQEGRFSLPGRAGIPGPPGVTYRVIYKVDGDPIRVWHCDAYPYRTVAGPRDEIAAKYPEVTSEFPGWTPSIHMPRWASRLTLTVTDVRVQQLQEISEDDCLAEGPTSIIYAHGLGSLDGPMIPDDQNPHVSMAPRTWYRGLWNKINGDRAWDANPWIVALTFTVERRNIDA